jgi:hypothetical protein
VESVSVRNVRTAGPPWQKLKFAIVQLDYASTINAYYLSSYDAVFSLSKIALGLTDCEFEKTRTSRLRIFPLESLPFPAISSNPKCVTALGHHVIDLQLLEDAGAFQDFPELDANFFSRSTLNPFLEQAPSVLPQVRQRLIDRFRLDEGDTFLRSNPKLQQDAVHNDTLKATATKNTTVPMKMHLPVTVRESMRQMSERCFEERTMPSNPIGCICPWAIMDDRARSSPLELPFRRPHGQLQLDPTDPTKGSRFVPCQRLDYE